MFRYFWGGLVLGCLSLVLAEGSFASEKTKLKLVFPTPPTTYALPHFVAQDLGWLEKAGLEVEEVWLVGDQNALRAMFAGNAHMAIVGWFPLFTGVAQGAKMKAIASYQPVVDHWLVAREQYTSIKDLTGTRVAIGGTGSITEVVPRMLMQKYGVDPKQSSNLVVGGHSDRLAAVLANKADATIVGTLYAVEGKRAGKINILSNVASEYPGLGYVTLVVPDEHLANPALRKAFETYVKLAVIEASRFVVKNPEEAIKVMRGRTPKLETEVIREVLGLLNKSNVWGVNGGVDLSLVDFSAKLALDMNVVKQAVDLRQSVDRSIVEKLLAELGSM